MATAADFLSALDDVLGEENAKDRHYGFLDTGLPMLNKALSGGYKRGFVQSKLIEIYGPSSSGKCQPASTMVMGKHGLISIGEMFELNGFNPSCTSREVEHEYQMLNEHGNLEKTSHFTWNNRKPIKRLIGKNGYITEATYNHPLRVIDELGNIVWKNAKDIKVGDYLPMLRGTEHFGKSSLTEDQARFIGYLVADGSLSMANKFGFTNSDKEISDWYCNFVKSMGMKIYLNDDPSRAPTYWTHVKQNREFIERQFGLKIERAAGKDVPLCVRTAKREVQLSFIQSYFECECHINSNKGEIEVASASRKLLSDVQLMLLNIGIVSNLSEKEVDGVTYHRLRLNNGNAKKYCEDVGFKTSARIKKANELLDKGMIRESNYDQIPHMLDTIKSLYRSVDTTREDNAVFDRIFYGSQSITYSKLHEVIACLKDRQIGLNRHLFEKLEMLYDRWYFYERIDDIEEDIAPTFDVCLPVTHSFWANGFISHNTLLATMAMKACQEQGGIAFFADHERSFEPHFAEKLGLNLDRTVFRHLQPKTFEDSVDVMVQTVEMLREKGMPLEIPIIWVFDSLASMIPQSKFVDDKGQRRKVGTFKMNDGMALPKCTSQYLPIVKVTAADHNCTVLMLNQTGKNPGVMFGDPVVTKGGEAPKYYADSRIALVKKELVTGTGKDKKSVGVEITAHMTKNKLTKPGTKTHWQMRYDDLITYVDRIASLVDYCVEQGFIQKNGTRVEWNGKKLFQSQLVDELKASPTGWDELLALLPDDEQLTSSEASNFGISVQED